MIRNAELKDKDEIKNLILEFHEESLGEYKLSFDWLTVDQLIKSYIDKNIILVAEEGNKVIGLIAGLVTKSIFDDSQLVGQETIWFITKDRRKGSTGIKLLKAFEDACKNRGATAIAMVYMKNLGADVLSRFYKLNKYKEMEVQCVKGV